MTEQNNAENAVVEADAAVPAPSKVKSAKKKITKAPAKTAKKSKASAPKPDEEKRLAKNAAVRAWRAANKDRFSAYMKSWREAKKAKGKKKTNKSTAKTAKRIGKAATA